MKNKIKFIIALCFVCLAVSCTTTIAPKPLVSTTASWDGNEQNGGFQGFTTNSVGVYGMITLHAHDRYNALIDIYGKKFLPPLTKDYGITDNKTNYLITMEGLADFAKMNRWKKSEPVK